MAMQSQDPAEGGAIVPASQPGPLSGPRRFRLPPKVESEVDPERMVPFDETVGRDWIVIVGTFGKAFDAGLGEAVRVLWLPANEYELIGPDRNQANVSLVPATSIPARTAGEVQERLTGGTPPERACVTCRVDKRASKKRPGSTYYVLIGD